MFYIAKSLVPSLQPNLFSTLHLRTRPSIKRPSHEYLPTKWDQRASYHFSPHPWGETLPSGDLRASDFWRFNNNLSLDTAEINAMRADKKFPCLSTCKNWITRFVNEGKTFPGFLLVVSFLPSLRPASGRIRLAVTIVVAACLREK